MQKVRYWWKFLELGNFSIGKLWNTLFCLTEVCQMMSSGRYHNVIIHYNDVQNTSLWRHNFLRKENEEIEPFTYLPWRQNYNIVRIRSLDILRLSRVASRHFYGIQWFGMVLKKMKYSLKRLLKPVNEKEKIKSKKIELTSLTNLTIFFRFIIITLALRPPIVIIPDRVTTSTLILNEINYK